MRTAEIVITNPRVKSAMEKLQGFLESRKATPKAVADLREYEKQLHKLVAEVECEAIEEELRKFDVNVPEIEIEGRKYKQVVRSSETYLCIAGEVKVERSLYRAERQERAISAMELKAGIVEGMWTPLAAEVGAWTVAHLTPRESQELFERIGGFKPSRSSLDRLVREIGKNWEKEREKNELIISQEEKVPDLAVSCAVSLDGVMIALKEGKRAEKREAAKAEGKSATGPLGYSEASCATVSFYDKEGEMLSTLRFGRMPESKKVTLKEMICREVEVIIKQRPDLKYVAIADGAVDNWKFLDKLLPRAEKVLDFYHATEHLKVALDSAYGDGSSKTTSQFEKLRHILRHNNNGVESVIRSLIHLRKKHPRRKIIARELAYFRKNRKRMSYSQIAESKLPIGSGIVEAACKTLVSQRMKCSGMRWRLDGGQAILTLRSLIQSERFDSAWKLLLNSYKSVISLPTNVLSITFSSKKSSV
jgi:hypothetical protein